MKPPAPAGARGHALYESSQGRSRPVHSVLQIVLTDDNISSVLTAANDPKRYDEAREHRLTRKDVLEPPILAENQIWESKEPLGRFTDGMRGRPVGAAVHYSIPLPEDYLLAGMHQ